MNTRMSLRVGAVMAAGALMFGLAGCSEEAAPDPSETIPTVMMNPEATPGWNAYLGYMAELSDLICALPEHSSVDAELAKKFQDFNDRVQDDPKLDNSGLGVEYGLDLQATAASANDSVQKTVGSTLDDDQKGLLKAMCESQQQYVTQLPAVEPTEVPNPAPGLGSTPEPPAEESPVESDVE